MPNITLKFSTSLVLVVALLSVVLLTSLSREALSLLASESSSAARTQSDAGGQTASPNPGNRGAGQEERVRQVLAEDYEQRFGASDEAIRNALNIRGKVADFVGYNARTNRWLIAESKGSDLDAAYNQLQNTMKGLLTEIPDAQIELRIYLDAKNYQILSDGGKIYGRAMNAERFLGFFDEAEQWQYEFIRGIRILVQAAP